MVADIRPRVIVQRDALDVVNHVVDIRCAAHFAIKLERVGPPRKVAIDRRDFFVQNVTKTENYQFK